MCAHTHLAPLLSSGGRVERWEEERGGIPEPQWPLQPRVGWSPSPLASPAAEERERGGERDGSLFGSLTLEDPDKRAGSEGEGRNRKVWL